MKKARIIWLVFSLIGNVALSQNTGQLEILKRYDYEKAKQIINDTLWLKHELWKMSSLASLNEASKVQFVIIPILNFTENASDYDQKSSLIQYLRTEDRMVAAFVVYEGQFLGYIKANYAPRYDARRDNDTLYRGFIDLLYRIKDTIIGYNWYINSDTEFGVNQISYNFRRSMYNLIETRKPTLFFTLPNYDWELWFIENNRLKAFSIHKDMIFEEKDLIVGIQKTVIDGYVHFFLNYNKKNPCQPITP